MNWTPHIYSESEDDSARPLIWFWCTENMASAILYSSEPSFVCRTGCNLDKGRSNQYLLETMCKSCHLSISSHVLDGDFKKIFSKIMSTCHWRLRRKNNWAISPHLQRANFRFRATSSANQSCPGLLTSADAGCGVQRPPLLSSGSADAASAAGPGPRRGPR